jgi:hypothetical protein
MVGQRCLVILQAESWNADENAETSKDIRSMNKEERIMNSKSSKVSAIVSLVLRAVALGMGVATIVMGILGTVPVETLVSLLAIGLFTLALDALDRGPEPE